MADPDHEARSMAQNVSGRLDGHERICTERWNESRKTMERVEKGVAGLYTRWWSMAVGLVVSLLALIATVAAAAFWLGDKLSKIP